MSIFGTFISRKDIEAAMKATLMMWFDTYLSEVERQSGLAVGHYQRPLDYTTNNNFTHWEEDQLPLIIIISPGLNAAPIKRGDGTFATSWAVGVAAVVSESTEEATRAMASDFGLAIRALVTQRPSLNGFASGSVWMDETYEDIDTDMRRSLASAQVIFTVEVDNVVQANAGPTTPSEPPADPQAPYPDWPIATKGSLTVVKEEI